MSIAVARTEAAIRVIFGWVAVLPARSSAGARNGILPNVLSEGDKRSTTGKQYLIDRTMDIVTCRATRQSGAARIGGITIDRASRHPIPTVEQLDPKELR